MLVIFVFNSFYTYYLRYLTQGGEEFVQLVAVIDIQLHLSLKDTVVGGEVDGMQVDTELLGQRLEHLDQYAELVNTLYLDGLDEGLYAVWPHCFVLLLVPDTE